MTKIQRQIKRVLLSDEAGLFPDKVTVHNDGTVSVYRGYFVLRHGMTAELWLTQVLDALAAQGIQAQGIGHDDYERWPKDSYFRAHIKEAIVS